MTKIVTVDADDDLREFAEYVQRGVNLHAPLVSEEKMIAVLSQYVGALWVTTEETHAGGILAVVSTNIQMGADAQMKRKG